MSARGVILVSDKQARLKPCLRCGYSLRHIAGSRNCPECGLAVRISLSGNSGLEWSNPSWQRFLALGFGVLALAMLCQVLSFCAWWIVYGAIEHYYQMSDATFMLSRMPGRYASEAVPIISGLALCLLARSEQRYPDESRPVRAIRLGAGALLIALGLLDAFARQGFWPSGLTWVWYIRYYPLHGPWLPLVVSILTCAYALELARRSGSRLLRRLFQVPLWPAAAGLVVWLLNIDRLFWPTEQLLTELVFPLTMILMLAVTIRVLLSGAREAELNWVTDP